MHHHVLNIAIGLLCHQAKILVGWREASQHQGNQFEFPGGKCELGESPLAACQREIFEEVGLKQRHWRSLGCNEFDYGDVYLRLHWFQTQVDVQDLKQNTAQNIATSLGGWRWVEREALLDLKFPKANRSILARLQWPRLLKISPTLSDLQQHHSLMYWRADDSLQSDPQGHADQLHDAQDNNNSLIESLVQQLQPLPVEALNRLVLNVAYWQQLPQALQQQLHTVHLKQHQLLKMTAAQLHPQLRYIAACHDAASLNKAEQLHCDAVLLSPVQSTSTHPFTTPLGWDDFAVLAANCHVPIYALGGVAPSDLEHALQYGAYGVAGISQF